MSKQVPRLFRVVLRAASDLRLMENAVAGPASWQILLNGAAKRLVVSDVIDEGEPGPVHIAMQFCAEVEAPDIETAVEEACAVFTASRLRRAQQQIRHQALIGALLGEGSER